MERPEFPEALQERYRVERLIGEGGMGRVYLAEDRKLQRRVAIKVLQVGVFSPDCLVRFGREAQALVELGHPALVRILDADLAGDAPAIVMEWLEGETLGARLRREPLPPGLTVTVLSSVLEGLNHIHVRGMLHRDIKPSNIFLRASGETVLIDFGLVMRSDETRLTHPGAMLGTLRYLAPELLQGGTAGVTSDLFALGVSAIEMLECTDIHMAAQNPAAGELMRIGSSLVSGSYLQVAMRLMKPHGALGRVVLKALAQEPEDRFQSAPEMLAALNNVGQAPQARTGRRVTADTRVLTASPVRRSRRGLIGSLLALGMCSLAIWAYFQQPTKNRAVPTERPITHRITGPAEMEVILDAPPEGGRVEFLGIVAEPMRPGEKPPILRFSGLPAGRVGRLTRRTSSRSVEFGPEIRTPELIHAEGFTCQPLDRALLVDFRLSPPVGAVVQISRAGQLVSRHEVKPNQILYHDVIGKLSPSTWYDLEVIPRTGWGGVNRWPVRTLLDKHSEHLKSAIEQLSGGGVSAAVALSYITTNPDPRVIPKLKRFFEDLPPGIIPLLDSTPTIAEALRSVELVDSLLVAVKTTLGQPFEVSVLRAAARVHHPRAAALGLKALREKRYYARAAALEAVACPAGAPGFDLVGELMEPYPADRVGVRLAMRAMDRTRARACFGRWAWLPSKRADWRPWTGALGLSELGESADINELLNILKGHQETAGRSFAALALARLADARIAPALADALRRDPESPGLMVAAARGRASEATEIFRRDLAAREPLVRAGAVTCLAAMEEERDTALFRSLLEDRDEAVRAAAAWALGARQDRGAKEALLAGLRNRSDPEGAFAWAIGRLRSPEGYRLLVARLERLVKDAQLGDNSATAQLCLALGEQGNAEVLPLLRVVEHHPAVGPYTSRAANLTANRLRSVGVTQILLVPHRIPMPEPIHVQAGDVISVYCAGLPRVMAEQGSSGDPMAMWSVNAQLEIGNTLIQVGRSPVRTVTQADGDILLLTGPDFETNLVYRGFPEFRRGFSWIALTVDRRKRVER